MLLFIVWRSLFQFQKSLFNLKEILNCLFLFLFFRSPATSSFGYSFCPQCSLSASGCFFGNLHWSVECVVTVMWHRHHVRTTPAVVAKDWCFPAQHSFESRQYKVAPDSGYHYGVSITKVLEELDGACFFFYPFLISCYNFSFYFTQNLC